MTASAHPSASQMRVAAIDVARGAAIVAMVIYHFAWDLSFLGFLATDISEDPGWTWFQRTILGSFLLLVGAGLVLAHGRGIRWRPFWRRTGVIAVAAAAMSLGTWLAFGEAFAFFGVLHAIVLFSIGGLLFLRAPPAVVVAAALVFIVPSILFRWEAFDSPWLAWLGFWVVPPRTADLVPVFPWFGMTLLGIAGTRIAIARGLVPRLAAWSARGLPFALLARAGRWSLFVYLVHQPLLLAGLYPLALWLQPGVPPPAAFTREEGFITECRTSCVESGGVEAYCTAYCACALEQIDRNGLWDAVETPGADPESASGLGDVITLCRAMAE